MKTIRNLANVLDERLMAKIFPIESLAGLFVLVAVIVGCFGALVLNDNRMSTRATTAANNLVSGTWTKVSAKPMKSRAYPNGNGEYVVRLHRNVSQLCLDVNTPEDCVADRKLYVADDDSRGQAILAIPDGSQVQFERVPSARFRSRAMAYNYLQPRSIVSPDSQFGEVTRQ